MRRRHLRHQCVLRRWRVHLRDGYKMDAADTCQDVDECQIDNGGCGDPAFVTCNNTPGSATCTDVDECLTFNGVR